ncbi:MAG: hypothetical protein HWE20_15070 [Gammaproteobacteria bacterium]|nr:hypothetical protein [Gammaproteobacteria bacterium]
MAGGPKTHAGRQRSSLNSLKHGLSLEVEFVSDPLFALLKEEFVMLGYSSMEASVASNALLECRRVSQAYADVFWSVEFDTKPLLDDPLQLAHFHIEQDGPYSSADIKTIFKMLNSRSSKDRLFGSIEGKRIAKLHPMIRYHRNAVSALQNSITSKK